MKTVIKTLFLLFTIGYFQNSNAQFFDKLAKKAEKATERAIERKVEQKATKSTNEAMDGVLNNKKPNKTSTAESSKSKSISKTTSDFQSGTKILFEENFTSDAIGDFPLKWFTNSSGEIVNFDSDLKKWLQLSDKGSFSPNSITKLPENFTFEFDVTTSDNFNYYSTPLNIVFTEKKSKTDNVWNTTLKRNEGVIFNVHPTNSLAGTGKSEIIVISEKKQLIKNNVDVPNFNKNNNTVRIQIWRQKSRLRMYVDGKKYWDLPSAFSDVNYNQVIFFIGTYKNPVDKLFISNLKLAEAGEDKRHQLIETGNFSTDGILFDTNKANIKPISKKVLDELGIALKENPTVKISITGHTDNVGSTNDNQKLSEKRAEAVADYFVSNYNISKTRFETNGKGSSEPIVENTSDTKKAQNRRVAFKIIN